MAMIEGRKTLAALTQSFSAFSQTSNTVHVQKGLEYTESVNRINTQQIGSFYPASMCVEYLIRLI